MKHRHYLKRRAVASKYDNQYLAYKKQRNRVNNLIRSAKKKFCLQTIDRNRNNPKEMWKNINVILGRRGRCSKTTIIPSIRVDNTTFTQEDQIMETLNTF